MAIDEQEEMVSNINDDGDDDDDGNCYTIDVRDSGGIIDHTRSDTVITSIHELTYGCCVSEMPLVMGPFLPLKTSKQVKQVRPRR